MCCNFFFIFSKVMIMDQLIAYETKKITTHHHPINIYIFYPPYTKKNIQNYESKNVIGYMLCLCYSYCKVIFFVIIFYVLFFI